MFLVGLVIIPSISATEFDTFTIQIVGLIKIAVALVGLIIIMFTVYSFFAGGPSMIRLVVMLAYIGVVILIVLIFIPILIGFMSTTIG